MRAPSDVLAFWNVLEPTRLLTERNPCWLHQSGSTRPMSSVPGTFFGICSMVSTTSALS